MNITVKDLLDAGVHFGHQTKRWNPRSKPYIFDHRQGVSIIDLGKTHEALQQACDFVENLVGRRRRRAVRRHEAAGAGNRARGGDGAPACPTASTAGSAAR